MPYWGEVKERKALAWFARQQGRDLFAKVPVAAPGWRGWPSETTPHFLSAVMVGDGEGAVRDWNEDAFLQALGSDLRPILAWSYNDRPALGELLVGMAMFQRSFPEHGTLHPAVLVIAKEHPSNTDPAYRERGIEIVVVPDEELA